MTYKATRRLQSQYFQFGELHNDLSDSINYAVGRDTEDSYVEQLKRDIWNARLRDFGWNLFGVSDPI